MNNSEIKETSKAFSYRLAKDQKVMIYWHDVQIKILTGKNAERLLQKIAHAEDNSLQTLLAKETNNLKRKKDGNTETIVIRGVYHTRLIHS